MNPTPLKKLKEDKAVIKMFAKRDKELDLMKKKHEKVRMNIVSENLG